MTYTKPVAIFSIDHQDDFTTLRKFMHYLDNLWVLGHLNYKPRKCTGMWEGEMEESFCMDLADFKEYALSWCLEQDAILEVHPKSYRQPHIKLGFLVDRVAETTTMIGEFKKVESRDIHWYGGYTYFMDTKEYYTCV